MALILALICLLSPLVLPNSFVEAQSTTSSPPTIAWQQQYGDRIESVSNLVQTTDGGYIFMDLGWSYQETFTPTTVYKVDSSGNIQWKRTIDWFVGSTIIQTSDGGYEIAGQWSTYGTTYKYTPTLIKTDSQANIQWVQNYSKVPNLGVITSTMPNIVAYTSSNLRTQTSDGGFAYWDYQYNSSFQTIAKTDANSNIQWVENLTFANDYGITILPITSLIETSDGALAALGVGYMIPGSPLTGKIYLVKTEPFLPLPSPTTLPTPIQTSSMILSEPVLASIIIALALVILVIVSLLLRKHRKTR